jgi:hypothetical protein
MKRALLFLILGAAVSVNAQSYKGPKTGSVAGGVIVNTGSFLPAGPMDYPAPILAPPRNKIPEYPTAPSPGAIMPAAPMGSNYIEDPAAGTGASTVPPVPLLSIKGIPDTSMLGYSHIPPDPYATAGPTHVIATVNTGFRIIDKTGRTLKTISAASWYESADTALSGLDSPFDPKIAYDHYAGRWVMVWLQERDADSTSHFLISVSQDSSALGTWYNYSLPATVLGDSAVKSWADYEGLGFDDKAVYLTDNQFAFGGNFQWVRLRIIPKTQLYANTAGPVTWYDLWDIRDAGNSTVFTTRPSITFGPTGVYYLVGMPNFTTGSYFDLFTVANPTTAPSISVAQIPATAWSSPTNADQLGGGTPLIELGGDRIRFEPVYRDSSIWFVHPVASGAANAYASVRYVRINTFSKTLLEDVAFGASGFWALYPALMVDKDKNVAITYSRSGLTEYAGAYMTMRLASDPPGLRPSTTIKAGKGNYVKTYGGTRNRWGDYNGIALDPADQNNFWIFTEYAESPANTWGTWFLNCRLIPVPGIRIASTQSSIAFGNLETGTSSDTAKVILYNYGTNALSISSIGNSLASYSLLDVPSTFPVVLNTFDSLAFRVYFHPTTHGVANDSVVITSNDPVRPTTKVMLNAKGILIGRAQVGVMYGTSGKPSAKLYQVSPATGAATLVGSLVYPGVDALTIRPSTMELYGVSGGATTSDVYRISAGYGDAFPYMTIPLGNIRAMAFSQGDTLYVGTLTGKVYRAAPPSGDTTFVGTAASVSFSGMSFRPVSGELWASLRSNNKIYKINTTNGASTLVGATGVSGYTSHIAFGPRGELYSVAGTASSSLYKLDTLTAASTLIGASAAGPIVTLAYRTDSLLTSVASQSIGDVPQTYTLEQNYPNPFNPVTQIRFGLPRQSNVTLTIFNTVGQKVATLAEGVRAAGYHEITWDGRNQAGTNVASGVYFYRLEARSADSGPSGSFIDIKKMVLLK